MMIYPEAKKTAMDNIRSREFLIESVNERKSNENCYNIFDIEFRVRLHTLM
jgi:hypothetical protein